MSAIAITCVSAAFGLITGTPGKGCLLFSNSLNANLDKLTYPEYREKPVRKINIIAQGDALTEQLYPPVKVLFVYSSNPLSIAPDMSKVKAGFSREEKGENLKPRLSPISVS